MAAKGKIRQLTTGTHDFESLVRDKTKKYVDKTDLLYDLATPMTDAQFFISRPRRFGKSLMLSTLQAMFEGRRELFRGLKIDGLPWECWEEHGNLRYPVYNFTMSEVEGDSYAELKEQLGILVDGLYEQAGIKIPDKGTVQGKFAAFIKAAAAKSPTKKIVILIDEYDEPVAGFLDDIKTLKRVRKLLHDFYEKLKTNSDVIRFLMMTGVTKLTKLSVFSGLTHLTDLSADPRFATLLGYTPNELKGPLRENVEALAARLEVDCETAMAKILGWYDGYRFSPQSENRVINPVSLGKLFAPAGGEFRSYWETTGGSSLVFNSIKASGKLPEDLENVRVRPVQLDVCDAETLPVEALLYQAGYLTIKEVIHSERPEDKGIAARDTYRLAPPNEEIRQSLRDGYISRILGFKDDPFETLVDKAKAQLVAGDIEHFLYESLFGLYASIPADWQIKDEAEAKRYFQLFASMCGANPQPEVASIFGYADAVIETPDNVFVFEFKYKRSAKAAITQIKDRNYAAKWLGGPRPVTLVGINFNPKVRNIDMPIIERA
ncbi:MAG: AAA family ATPase [Kiritimatiellae bacterium]|nr:AAA family ATPase [Kiritimatiellia bacterium]